MDMSHAAIEREIYKTCCEHSFSFFTKQALKVIEKETKFIWNWHMDAICDHCQLVYNGEYSNLDINVPPRTLKSIIVNVLFPCWVWIKDSSKKFLCASGSFDLAVNFSIKRRDLILSSWYQYYWPIQLKEYKNRVDEFENVNNGNMKAISAMGKVTGNGGDINISDDLLDAMDSLSATKREAVRTWYKTAFYNRVQSIDNSKRININQRLHKDDISGLLRTLDFDRLVLPMKKTDKNESTVRFKDPRRVGELLMPVRFSEKAYQEYKTRLGSYIFSGQYQQSPTPIGGGIIKESWLRYHNNSEGRFEKKILVADLTFKGNESSDYNSLAIWGLFRGNYYHVDQLRGKWSYVQLKKVFEEFYLKHNPTATYIEDKANGSALISELKQDNRFINIFAWPLKGSRFAGADKVQRLLLCQASFELGKVYILESNDPIYIDYKEEILGFTDKGSTTGNDDMVDTTTMAILELQSNNKSFSIGNIK